MDEDRLKRIIRTITTEEYKRLSKDFTETLEHSLHPEAVNDKRTHLVMQEAVLEIIEAAEKNASEGRQKYKDTKNEGWRNMADINRMCALNYREIGDGVAWRTLGHDRMVLRIMAQSQSPGFAATSQGPKKGRDAEVKYARKVVGMDYYALLHDTTNHLRVGDVSMLKPLGNKPLLIEAKSKKPLALPSLKEKELKGALTDQEKRLMQAQEMITEDEIYNPNMRARAVRLYQPVKTLHEEVEKLINDARRTGIASGDFDYMQLQAVNFDATSIEDMKGDQNRGSGPILPFSNYDNLGIKMQGEVIRNKAPYSVYPYSPSNRAALITGDVYLVCLIDIDKLTVAADRLGWTVTFLMPEHDPEVKTRFGGPDLFKDYGQEAKVTFVYRETGFTIISGMEILGKIGYEFFTLESLLKPYERYAKYLIAAGLRGSSNAYYINDAENEIWD